MNTTEDILRDVREKSAAQDREIQEEIYKILDPFKKRMRKELEREFGRALLRDAQLLDIEDVLDAALFAGADVAKKVLTRYRHQEINQNTATLLKTALSAGERRAAAG